MNILIIGGFLGSGKTSILLQLAKYLVKREKDYESETKVAIVENEIGKIGIDDKILRDAGFQVNNLFSGCACCTLSGELITFIDDIQKSMGPKWIIVEASGVAYPGSIRDTIIKYRNWNPYILTIVDASRWNRLRVAMETLVIGQLSDSMTVFVNKVDLIDKDELEKVKESILSYNYKIDLYTVSAIEEISDDILSSILNSVDLISHDNSMEENGNE